MEQAHEMTAKVAAVEKILARATGTAAADMGGLRNQVDNAQHFIDTWGAAMDKGAPIGKDYFWGTYR